MLGFALGLLQMLLYAIYRNGDVKKQVVTEEKEKEQGLEPMKNIVIVNPLGTCEVFPIPVDDAMGVADDVNQQLQGKKGAPEKEKSVEANNCPV